MLGPTQDRERPQVYTYTHTCTHTPRFSLLPPWVFLHPPTERQRQGWSLYLRGIIGIKLAPRATGPGGGAERGGGAEVLLAIRGLGPRGGSELQVIFIEVRSLGPWLRDLGPGHPGLGLRWVAPFTSWKILHELAQFCIIRGILQERLDLGVGG